MRTCALGRASSIGCRKNSGNPSVLSPLDRGDDTPCEFLCFADVERNVELSTNQELDLER